MARNILNLFFSFSRPSDNILGCSIVSVCILPIAQIAIGSVYLNECPRQPYIPVYLIVSGVSVMLLSILGCLPCTKEDKDGQPNTLTKICFLWNGVTTLFFFAWFITGNVWIYTIYQPNYNKNTTNVDPYCNKTLYLFAFWTTMLVYIPLCGLLLCGFCILFCLKLCKNKLNNHNGGGLYEPTVTSDMAI